MASAMLERRHVDEPNTWSSIHEGRRYRLVVSQQPQRARMCGFGDKDRRPITPPPCIRLIISDANSGRECDVNEIDYSKFVLIVELWSEDGLRELNLVRHSATSPCITNSIPFSHSQASAIIPGPLSNLPSGPTIPSNTQFKYENSALYNTTPPAFNPYPGPPQVTPYSQAPVQQSYGGQQYQSGYNMNGHQSGGYQPQYGSHPQFFATGSNIHAMGHAAMASAGNHNMPPMGNSNISPMATQNMSPMGHPNTHPLVNSNMPPAGSSAIPQPGIDYGPVGQTLPQHSSLSSYGGRPFTAADLQSLHRMPTSSTAPTGMFTRNLIGSLSASASRLTDPDDRIGIWFVLQDLSVRTEGTFRLRFSFVNVGLIGSPSQPGPQGQLHRQQGTVNTGRAPVLAAVFSESFVVFSAKKFPGVVESTPLSKCFATQGIKIPIRKDGVGKGDKAGKDDYDDE